jgi:hypothetical protein
MKKRFVIFGLIGLAVTCAILRVQTASPQTAASEGTVGDDRASTRYGESRGAEVRLNSQAGLGSIGGTANIAEIARQADLLVVGEVTQVQSLGTQQVTLDGTSISVEVYGATTRVDRTLKIVRPLGEAAGR